MKIEKTSFLDKISFYVTSLMVATVICHIFFLISLLYNNINLNINFKEILLIFLIFFIILINYVSIIDTRTPFYKIIPLSYSVNLSLTIILFALYVLYLSLTSNLNLTIIHLIESGSITWFLHLVFIVLIIINALLYFAAIVLSFILLLKILIEIFKNWNKNIVYKITIKEEIK